MPAHLTLHLLGTPRVTDASGSTVDLPLGKPMAALCYVALERGRVTRDDLGSLLWARSARDRARGSVRQALWLLRKTLGDDVVDEDERGLELNRDRVSLDLDDLEAHLAAGRVDEAWALWDGGMLADFSIPDSPAWQRWADRIRTSWERRVGDALEAHAASQAGEDRITWLRRALEVRPYRDSLHGMLVEALVDLRRLDEAEAALHRARSVMDPPAAGGQSDYGTLVDFGELEERLSALRRAPFEDGDEGLQVEFVGRAREFASLAELWRSVLSGRPRAAAILGPAGIGKTRLADELVELARVDGAAVAEVKGFGSERSIELGGVASLARDLLGMPGAAGIGSGSLHVLRSLVPSASGGAGLDEVPTDRPSMAALSDAFLDLLEALAHEAPLIVRVEDLHWLDRASRSLLFRTVRHLRDARVLLLATCRTEEPDQAALRLLRAMAEQERVRLVELGPLSRGEVGEMLGLMFAFPDDRAADAASDRLYRASSGNPLFLIELLRGLEDDGWIHPRAAPGEPADSGTSEAPEAPETPATSPEEGPDRVLELPERITLPGSVRQALERRLSHLEEDAVRVAAALVEAERPLRPTELMEAAGLGESAGVAALAELLRRDVVRWDGQERLVPAHDSLRAPIRDAERRVGKAGSPDGGAVAEVANVAEAGAAGDRGARGGAGRPLAYAASAVAVVGLLLVALVLVERGGVAGSAGPLGGGQLFVQTDPARMVGLELRETEEGIALDTVETLVAPAGLALRGPPVRGDGGWSVAAAGAPDLAEEPDAWLVEWGDARRVFQSPGDDLAEAILADGRHALIRSQDPDTSWYRLDLLRLNLETGDTTVLHPFVMTPSLSPDHRWILARRGRLADSLFVLRHDGTVAHAVDAPGEAIVAAAWCPPDGQVIGLSEVPGSGPRPWLWRPGEGDPPADLEIPLPLATRVECSPDGSLLAVDAFVGGRNRLVIVDRESGEVLASHDLGSVRTMHWIPDVPAVAPSYVRLDRDGLALRRGERDTLRPEIGGVPSGLDPERVRWTSRDSLTAFVDDRGVVTGIGPGSTWILVDVDRWLRDSLRVEIQEGEMERTAIADPMDDVDLERWRILGDPAPVAARFEGRPVLSMPGDASRVDGLITRDAFAVDAGATLEMDFHLRLTRVDRQSVRLCLFDAEPPDAEGSDERDLGAWSVERRFCFQWPAYELERHDPNEAFFGPGPPVMGPVSLAEVLRPDDWNRVSIQIRPDGRISLFLNREYVVDFVQRLDLGPDPWRIAILGRAVETDLYVRNLVLWNELRYEVGS